MTRCSAVVVVVSLMVIGAATGISIALGDYARAAFSGTVLVVLGAVVLAYLSARDWRLP